jgi:hypothetical protein
MIEILTIVFAAVACFFSFIVGKVTNEKKVLSNQVRTISKGAAAGRAAVAAFRMRNKK